MRALQDGETATIGHAEYEIMDDGRLVEQRVVLHVSSFQLSELIQQRMQLRRQLAKIEQLITQYEELSNGTRISPDPVVCR